MTKYIVKAETTVLYETIIEADSLEEANEKAEQLEDFDFDCVGEFNFSIYHIEEEL